MSKRIGLQGVQSGLQIFQELVGNRIQNDKPLGRAADSGGVAHATPDRPRNRFVQVGIVKHDEGISTAEFHGGLLQVLASAGRDLALGRQAAGQRHSLAARVVNHAVGVFVRDEQVGCGANKCTGIEQKRFEVDKALRYASRMHDYEHIAGHQLRPGHARQLVVREVPALDAEHHAQL